jgi:hypothetical protein
MSNTERRNQPSVASSGELDAAGRAEMLARFRGPVEASDAERVDFWCSRSDAEHAKAMIELADFAEMVVGHTGYHKDPADFFPGLPNVSAATGSPEPTSDGS